MHNVSKKQGRLALVRHHESEWNKLGLWTGHTDVHLTPYGFQKSEEMGTLLSDICFDYAFTSLYVRSIETFSSIVSVCTADAVLPVEHVAALNERDYGDYTGKNKWEVEKEIGAETFEKIRREWNYPVPHGETLKMVYDRAVPFFLEKVVPLLCEGKNVLIVSHGNTIRALVKYIERISDDDVKRLEMLFGSILIYDLDDEGHVVHKEVRAVDSQVNA